MKKFYVSFLCLLISVCLSAQTLYWRLPAGSLADYDDPNSWSFSSGGPAAGVVPNGPSYNIIFDRSAQVRIDIPAVTFNSALLTNNSTVNFFNTTPSTITALSTNAGNPALNVSTGSTLIDSAAVDGDFVFQFGTNAQGLVNGSWVFTGNPALTNPFSALYAPAGTNATINVNGALIVRNKGGGPIVDGLQLFLNSNSLYWHNRDGSDIPNATWHPTSTILVTGVIDQLPPINTPVNPHHIGNLVLNSPTMFSPIPDGLSWSLPNGLIIDGNFQIVNTNNVPVMLASASGAAGTPVNYTVNGNLEIGPNANVAFANFQDGDRPYNLSVRGNYVQTGGIFSLRNDRSIGAVTISEPTTLQLGGNFIQTAGTFTTNSTVISETEDLFVLEMNGGAPQTISASSQTIDNATNQVTLRMNNASGVTLLTPLETGRVSFASAAAGRINTTTANVLTIANPNTNALTVNSATNAGHVNGPVRRRTNATVAYVFPTGKGGVIDTAHVIPETTAPSLYQAEYFNTGYPDQSVIAPLIDASDSEYWEFVIVSGSPAAVRLSPNGTAVPNSTGANSLVVAKYNGADWQHAKGATGTTLTPDNSTTGFVRSGNFASFAPGQFTLGIVPNGSLPINLITFNAQKGNGNVAMLNWKIASGSTPERFEVLRSTDGRNFIPVGSVPGLETRMEYGFNDQELQRGTTFYRLQMYDKEGTATFSKIVAVINGGKGFIITSMMPTVVVNRSRLNISSSEKGSMQLVITDMHGRIIKTQVTNISSGNQEVWLELQSIASGAYQVIGYMNGERTDAIRFIKR